MKFKKILLPFSVLLLFPFAAICQKANNSLNNYFDNTIGLTNLGINNGPIHLNPFRAYDRSHRYHLTENYFTGDVRYDGQLYTNENLKYDVFKDVVVSKISGQNNSMGIDLIPEKTEYFTFSNKRYVNLGFGQNIPEFTKGFYEEYSENTPVTLYIKHHKDQIEVLTNDGVFYRYEPTTDFIFRYHHNFYKIKNAKSFSGLFPKDENKIDAYYETGRELEKSDKIQFMKNMVNFINNLLTADTN